MATPSLVRRIGDKAKDYISGIRALPIEDSDIAGLKANAQNVSGSAIAKPSAAPTQDTTAPQDKVNPNARYGDRPGEMRPDQVLAPLYDDGGDVSQKNMSFLALLEETLKNGQPNLLKNFRLQK